MQGDLLHVSSDPVTPLYPQLTPQPLPSRCFSCLWIIFTLVLTLSIFVVVGIYLGWYVPADPEIAKSINSSIDYVKDKLG